MVRETRRAGERGDARAFEYSLVAPAGSQGPPAPLRRRCPPGRCSGGALVTPRRRLRPEGRGLGRGERRGRERDGARLPNEPHGLRLGRRGHLLGRGGGSDGEVGRGKCQTCRLAPLRRDACVGCHGRGGSGERRAVGTPTRAARTPPAPPKPATDGVGAARSRALVGRAVRVARPRCSNSLRPRVCSDYFSLEDILVFLAFRCLQKIQLPGAGLAFLPSPVAATARTTLSPRHDLFF